jgi:hypothetical protein
MLPALSVTTVTLVPPGALVVSVTVPVFLSVVVVVVELSGFWVVVVELEPPLPPEDPPPEGPLEFWVHLACGVRFSVTGALKS